jgi:hypothetical protein
MTAYSTSLRLAEPVPGDPAVKNAWGTILNTNDVLIEASITGTAGVSIGGLTTYTLTTANGAADQARPLVQNYTGALTANCTVTLPNVPKLGWAINSTTGGFSVILTSGVGTTVTVPSGGRWYWYQCDGAGNVTFPSIGYGVMAPTSLAVAGNGTVGGTFGVTGNTTLSSTLTVTGATSLQSTLGVIGAATFYNNLSCSYQISAATLAVSASATVGTSFSVGTTFVAYGAVSCQTTLSVIGAVSFYSNLSVSGVLTVSGSYAGSSTACFFDAASMRTTPTYWADGIGIAVTYGVQAQGFYAVSDRRMKTDIRDITPEAGAEYVLAGRPRTYLMEGTPRAGFIAQEDLASGRAGGVRSIPDDRKMFAESDGYAPAGHHLIRDYDHDIAYLTAALQHALQRIEALEKVR